MILVTFAMPMEGRFLEKALSRQSAEVAILYTGVGPERAGKSLRQYLRENPLKLIIASGFAGGLDPALRRGDILMEIPESGPDFKGILPKLQKAGLSVRQGVLWSGEAIIDNREDRLRLQSQTNAQAVDMETGSIREAARSLGIPVLTCRVISDSVHEPMPVPPAVLFDLTAGKFRLAAIIGHLIRHPRKIPGILKFGGDCKKAARNLGKALRVVLDGIDD